MNNQKITVMDDQKHRVKFLTDNLEMAKAFLNEIAKAVKELQQGELTTNELMNVLTQGFIKNKVMSNIQAPKVGNIKLSKLKLADLVEMPDSYSFIEAVENYERFLKGIQNTELKNNNLIKFFKVENGNVVINETEVEKWKDSITLYANSEKQVEIFDVIKKACDALNEMRKVTCYKHRMITIYDWNRAIHEMPGIKWDRDQTEFVPDADFIHARAIE